MAGPRPKRVNAPTKTKTETGLARAREKTGDEGPHPSFVTEGDDGVFALNTKCS